MSIQTNKRDYRGDIDGLRAVAIVSVILYHIDASILPGGFAGVDVFFVISGYLITSHLMYEINIKKNFSFGRFYLKRIKRILPALLFMILTVLTVGYFILTDFYFQSLGEQAFSATLSYSNIYFYLTSGYFDLDSSLKPLLHTWSLGVEEQFYLIWPATLVSVMFFVKDAKYLLVAFVLLIVSSFLLNKIYSDDLNAIFYLMPPRIFEFSVGAIVAHLHINEKKELFENEDAIKNFFSIVAFALVLSPMFYLNDDSVFPYYNALPTVLGSGALIYFRKTFVGKLLSLRIVVFIGLISYSLYLYHWPVIVFTKYQFGDLSTVSFYAVVLSTSFVISVLSYQLIEKPFRFSKRISITALFATLIVIVFIVSFAVKFMLFSNSDFNQNLIDKSHIEANAERFSLNSNGCSIVNIEKEKNCNWNAENQILFFGNSHNMDAYNLFHSILGKNYKNNLIFGGNTYLCKYRYQSSGRVVSENGNCINGAEKLTSKEFISDIDILVVNFFKINTWGVGYLPIIDEMRKINPNLEIIVIGGFIGVRPNNCSELINKTGDLDICKSEKYVTYWGGQESQWILSQDFSKNNFLYIDRVELLCGEGRQLNNCITRNGKNLFFYDGDHFSLHGINYLSNLIADKYKLQLNNLNLHY